MRLIRFGDWQLRLDAFLSERLRTPFSWGVNDCALFSADAVLAITGVDLAWGLRGKSARAAARFIQEVGGLPMIVSSRLPMLESVDLAYEGDVLAVRLNSSRPGRLSLGVLNAFGDVVGPSRNGLVCVSRGQAVAAWGVGHG